MSSTAPSRKKSTKTFKEPKPHSSPQDRRRLAVLGAMAFVVILLFWIWTLPMNNRAADDGTVAGPGDFFGTIGGELSSLKGIGDIFSSFNGDNETN